MSDDMEKSDELEEFVEEEDEILTEMIEVNRSSVRVSRTTLSTLADHAQEMIDKHDYPGDSDLAQAVDEAYDALDQEACTSDHSILDEDEEIKDYVDIDPEDVPEGFEGQLEKERDESG